jgi:hypothetical protein
MKAGKSRRLPRSVARAETNLYGPVKAFLEAAGYEVKGEIHGCDVVALRDGEQTAVIEMKLSLNLDVLLQAVDRLALTDLVYIAVPAAQKPSSRLRDRRMLKLLRLMGVGLLAIGKGDRVEVLVEPGAYQPRKNRGRLRALLREHRARSGDPNTGGSTRRPLLTAYRQNALACAAALARDEYCSVKDVRRAAEVETAGRILLRNVYGWFERAGRGRYRLSASGREALVAWAGKWPGPDRQAPL